MIKDLRERLAKARASPGGPDPIVRDLRTRLEALQCGFLPVSKQVDFLELLRELVFEKSPERIQELLAEARKLFEEASLLTDLHIPRVDLVSHPANMRPFLVAKGEDPFNDPEPTVPEIELGPVEEELAGLDLSWDPDRFDLSFEPDQLDLDLKEPAN